jgi:heme/copper-type cytochrome/quinol oxidase subunit 3
MFLATDVMIFASLFAVYAVYRMRTAGGPTPAQVMDLTPALVETLVLLTSSFTIALAVWSMRRGNRTALLAWLMVTAFLGAAFVGTELQEFAADLARGAAWSRSASLSSFFVLVATHGAHVTFGLIWAVALLAQVARRGLRPFTCRKVYTLSLYWHFLDIVWVFIFTYVYLGARL